MRRADRLFRIIQVLRRKRRPVTAHEIAEELEASARTIYRDIAQLMADRVPIRGEAGIGYVLEGGFDMPPLMLTPDEIEAAMLGAQWVMTRADPVLARAAVGSHRQDRRRDSRASASAADGAGADPADLASQPSRHDRHGAGARLHPRPGKDRAVLSR